MGKDVNYEIKEHLGVLSSSEKGWGKELNIISWNDTTPKFDIRSWSDDHKHMTKGITLFDDEMRELVNYYNSWKDNTENIADER